MRTIVPVLLSSVICLSAIPAKAYDLSQFNLLKHNWSGFDSQPVTTPDPFDFTVNIHGIKWDGVTANIQGSGAIRDSDLAGEYSAPWPSLATHYFAESWGGSIVTFSKPQTGVAMFVGSLDAYNELEFFPLDGSAPIVVIGSEIAAAFHLADNGSANTSLLISDLPAFSRMEVYSPNPAFEFQIPTRFEHGALTAVATPELSTWAMFGMGLISLGLVTAGKRRGERTI